MLLFFSGQLEVWGTCGPLVSAPRGLLHSTPCQGSHLLPQSPHLLSPCRFQESLLGGWRNLEDGLIHRALRDPKRSTHRQALLHLLSQALGLAGTPSEASASYSPQAFVKEMEVRGCERFLGADSGVMAVCIP